MFTVRDNRAQAFNDLDTIERQVRNANYLAANDTGFKVREVLQTGMMTVFDRPTPFITRSIWVNRATRDNPVAEVFPRYPGGKTTHPENILGPNVEGGGRRPKRSERALQYAGILPKGYYIAPGESAPLDQYGNVRGAFIVQLISYFKAFGEQGYRANMSDKRKAALARAGRTAQGYKTIQGVQYFVAYGKLRGGARRTRKGDFDQRAHNLPAGIWSRRGTHGVSVEPVLMFVRRPSYRPRLAYRVLGEQAIRDAYPQFFQARLQAGLRGAA